MQHSIIAFLACVVCLTDFAIRLGLAVHFVNLDKFVEKCCWPCAGGCSIVRDCICDVKARCGASTRCHMGKALDPVGQELMRSEVLPWAASGIGSIEGNKNRVKCISRYEIRGVERRQWSGIAVKITVAKGSVM